MKRPWKYILILCLIFPVFGRAQDSLKWTLLAQVNLPEGNLWTSDQYGQLYITGRDRISKYDSGGKLMFEQSLKKYGRISAIDAKNPMKIMLFSEQQQVVFYLDNALARQEAEIELSSFELSYVTLAESSYQPDKIWVYDQENSEILLMTSRSGQQIRIKNLKGLLNSASVERLMEQGNELWVLDEQGELFHFDLYGTLLGQEKLNDFTWIEVQENQLWKLRNNQLEIKSTLDQSKRSIALPVEGVERFEVKQNHLFLQRAGTIFHYRVE